MSSNQNNSSKTGNEGNSLDDTIGKQKEEAGSGQSENDTAKNTLKKKAKLIGFGLGIMLSLFLVANIIGILILGTYWLITSNMPSMGISMPITVISTGLAAAVVTILYINYSKNDWDYLDLKEPSTLQVGIILIASVVLFIFANTLSFVLNWVGLETTDHAIMEGVSQGSIEPTIFLVLIPLSILIIGPAEEIIFRGVIQKSLYKQFTKIASAGIAAILFGLMHISAYIRVDIMEAIGSIAAVTILGFALGVTYIKTENLVVPSLIHGIYNALLFGFAYVVTIGYMPAY